MSRKEVHTVPDGNGWANKEEGRTISRHRTQENAVEAGRDQAIDRGAEHVIHRPDGRIRESNSYGNDPCPPEDKR